MHQVVASASAVGVQLPPAFGPDPRAQDLIAQMRVEVERGLAALARSGLMVEGMIASLQVVLANLDAGASGEELVLVRAHMSAMTRYRHGAELLRSTYLDILDRLDVAEAAQDDGESRGAEDVFNELGWSADAEG